MDIDSLQPTVNENQIVFALPEVQSTDCWSVEMVNIVPHTPIEYQASSIPMGSPQPTIDGNH